MKKLNLFLVLLVALMLLPCNGTMAQKKSAKKKAQTAQVTTGAEDRAKWVEWMWKISYPVIHNLAENTLVKNMPIESRSGQTKGYDEVTYLEAVGRTLAGVAPWLALPDDDTDEGKLRKQMREEVLRGLKNAVDPESPDKINFTKQPQPIVDAAYLVHAFLRAPKALWEPLDDVTKQRYIESLKALRNRTGAYNNWLIFTGLNELFINWAGGECDPFRLKIAKNKIKEWYVGDGWYSDGPKFSMDNYNSYVLNPMYVAMSLGDLPYGCFPVVGRCGPAREAACSRKACSGALCLDCRTPQHVRGQSELRCQRLVGTGLQRPSARVCRRLHLYG